MTAAKHVNVIKEIPSGKFPEYAKVLKISILII